jgi:hypothetical protein
VQYVSPAKFKTMRLGIDVSDLDDVEVAAVLDRAATTVNGYCNVPISPAEHDFRGGTVGQGADNGVIDPLLVDPTGNPARAAYLVQSAESHQWRYPESPFDIGQRRYYAYHWPMKTINLFRIYVTNRQYVGIDPAYDLFINNQERYAEVVSLALTSSGLFNALIIPNVGLATPQARCWYTYGFDFVVTGESIYVTDGNTTYRSANQWWVNDSLNAPVNVYVNGTLQVGGYTVDYNEGTIIFAVPPGPEDDPSLPLSVTVDYHYRLPGNIRDAVALIARYEFGEADLAAKNLTGIESLKVVDQLSVSRPNSRAGMRNQGVNVDNLERLVPEAADLLSGYRFWSTAALMGGTAHA